ncbi:MAG TPA: hypothetical protein PKN36_00890 [bacterium]|nr:hypothetical protein [bacterium]
MLIWVFIILLMGILLSFGADFVARNNLVWCIGIVITLISLGICVRMSSLKKRGQKEKLLEKIKELEEKVKELSKTDA